jgi:acetyltransferase-like isoleucine patch superfamily enzyme
MLDDLLKVIIHNMGNIIRPAYLFYLKRLGVSIGRNSNISLRAKIDTRRGKIIIGENCYITYGCVILSHDATAKRIDPNDDGSGTVIIEDNVFIGVNSVVLRNVRIGRNSIIGAGSVVTQDVPPNVVVAGNPARILRQIGSRNKS